MIKYYCDRKGCENEAPLSVSQVKRIRVEGFPNIYIGRERFDNDSTQSTKYPALCRTCWDELITTLGVSVRP